MRETEAGGRERGRHVCSHIHAQSLQDGPAEIKFADQIHGQHGVRIPTSYGHRKP